MESSFEIDHSSFHTCHPQHHTTPISSHYGSSSPSPFNSRYLSSRNPTPHRVRRRAPATPFAADDDISWQGEVSWQFEPSGWRDSRNLGAALSPWALSTPSNINAFRRSAKDFYLSRTSGGFRSFANPYYDYPSHSGVPSGRLELHSYVARDNNSFLRSKKNKLGDHRKSHQGIPRLGKIEGTSRPVSPLATEDELSMIDYDTLDHVERQVHLSGTNHNLHKHDDPRWFSVSRAYMEDDDVFSHFHNHHGSSDGKHNNNVHELSQNGHDHGGHHRMSYKMDNLDDEFLHGHRGHDAWQSTSHHYGGGDGRYNDPELVSPYNEDDAEVAKPVGLFSLFKYSTKLDMILVLLGCIGALINGGALPWYSYFFGNFVNKIANESSDSDKTQMMKDAEKVQVIVDDLHYLIFF